MHPRRVRALAAVCAHVVAAGTIESSKGSASVTPAPRRNVRRDRWVLVRKAIGESPQATGYGLQATGHELNQRLFIVRLPSYAFRPRIRKDGLFTRLTTKAENRLSWLPPSRTMARMADISAADT